jgi:hypothetical protein
MSHGREYSRLPEWRIGICGKRIYNCLFTDIADRGRFFIELVLKLRRTDHG